MVCVVCTRMYTCVCVCICICRTGACVQVVLVVCVLFACVCCVAVSLCMCAYVHTWCVLHSSTHICACVYACTHMCTCVQRRGEEGLRPHPGDGGLASSQPPQHFHISLARFKDGGHSGPRKIMAEMSCCDSLNGMDVMGGSLAR